MNIKNIKTNIRQKTFSEIPEQEFCEFEKIFQHYFLDQGDYYIAPGETPQKLAFILEGVMKSSFITLNGREIIDVFYSEGEFLFPFTSFFFPLSPVLQSSSSSYQIQALEKVSLLQVSLTDFNQFCLRHPAWEKHLRKLVEKNYLLREKWKERRFAQKSLDRYYAFLQDFPHLSNRVPQYMIASFIGITPQSLCRLLKETRPMKIRGKNKKEMEK